MDSCVSVTSVIWKEQKPNNCKEQESEPSTRTALSLQREALDGNTPLPAARLLV